MQTIDAVILALYVIPLFMVWRTFSMSAQAFDRLPEKIPMHFNFRGKADQWWRKGRLAVYLLPFISLGTVLSMYAVFGFMVYQSGALPDGFNLSWLFLTFSLSFLFYKTQAGIIAYAQAEIENIWPTMGLGIGLLLVSSLLVSIAPVLPMQPKVLEAIMCETLEEGGPAGVRDTFSLDDPRATLFLKLGPIKGAHRIRMVWYDPQERAHFTYDKSTHPKSFVKYQTWWSYIYIADHAESVQPGNWHVEVFIDDQNVLNRGFSIRE